MSGITDFLFGSEQQPSVQQASTMTPQQASVLQVLGEVLYPQIGQGVSPYPGQMFAGAGPVQQGLFSFGQNALGDTGLLNQLLSSAGNITGQVGQGITGYSGELAAGESGLQSQSFDLISQLLGGDTGQSLTGAGTSAIEQLLQPYDSASAKEYWNTAVKQPMMESWESEILPVIEEKYAAMNAIDSGAFRRAVTGSAEDLMSNLGANLASTLYSGEQAALNRQAGLAPSAVQSGLNYNNLAAQLGLSGGATQQATQQNALNAAYQKWNQVQDYNNPWLNYLPQASSMFGQGLGLLGQLSGIGSTEQAMNQLPYSEAYQKWQTAQNYNNPWLAQLGAVLGAKPTENIVTQGSQSPGLLGSVASGLASGLGRSPQLFGWLGL